jgi:hypothetical protein
MATNVRKLSASPEAKLGEVLLQRLTGNVIHWFIIKRLPAF